jgi:hypothetical protein
MADVDHPKTHVENQEGVELPRTQPESPKREGIDPLTESDTMYPAEDTKAESKKLSKKIAKGTVKSTEDGRVSPNESANDYSDRSAEIANAQESQEDETSTEPGDNTGDGILNDEPTPQNADGKLPKDAQIVNDVGSDRGNTSPSNKVATQDAPKKGTTETKS